MDERDEAFVGIGQRARSSGGSMPAQAGRWRSLNRSKSPPSKSSSVGHTPVARAFST